MMQYYRFHLKDFIDSLEWEEALPPGHFAISENDGSTWYYFSLASEEEALSIQQTHGFETFEPVEMNDYVDWGVQWSTHSPNFKDYSLEIDLSKYTSVQDNVPILTLHAGPGFGDLSHPTTRLTLGMMGAYVQNRHVLDVGCGSGILSLAALLLGACSAHGIDIELDALQHAKENAAINHLEASFSLPDVFILTTEAPLFVVMNMISSQQREAWKSIPQIHDKPMDIITSGILIEERDSYVREWSEKGWSLVEERQEGDWMAFQWTVDPQV